MNDLIENVRQWAIEKGIDKADSKGQLLKVYEEVGETAQAFSKGKRDEMELEVGDVFVTMIIFAQQQEMSVEKCLELAYDKIKGRKGKVLNGVFVKEEDL